MTGNAPVPGVVVPKVKTCIMAYKIAIASNNGESVNQHFAKAQNFLIYEILEAKVEFIEDRIVNTGFNENPQTDNRIEVIINTLSDCKAVFVSNIGEKAKRQLDLNGIKSFAVNFSLNNIFTTLLKRQNSRVRLL